MAEQKTYSLALPEHLKNQPPITLYTSDLIGGRWQDCCAVNKNAAYDAKDAATYEQAVQRDEQHYSLGDNISQAERRKRMRQAFIQKILQKHHTNPQFSAHASGKETQPIYVKFVTED